MTRRLREAELVFLKRYQEWLAAVEEGLSSVAFFYKSGFKENGDRLLFQMLEGFEPFSSDNMTMNYLFGQEDKLSKEMDTFHENITEAKSVPELKDSDKQMQYITTKLIPAFQRWKLIVYRFHS